MTLLKFDDLFIGVTCQHVLSRYREMQETHANILFQVGQAQFNALQHLIQEDRDRDRWQGDSAMKIASVADVKARLSAYLEECESKGPVVITRNGKPVAVLLSPADDDDLEQLLLSRSPRFKAILSKSRKSIKAGRGLSRTEFWKAVRQRNKTGTRSP